MIAYLSLYKLRPEVTEEKQEDMMSRARMSLLRIPEVLTVKTGKRVNPCDPFPWFVYLEVESMDKLAMCLDDPHYIKFRDEVLKPHVAEQEATAFEMEPRKNVKYS
ncbi:Dabb family protein [Prosthecobacter sp. SYSU 5D2]|uniref:Dabb family protein n=1 Tax=Prosthecobacter sp. SYSU 5D2 TaxID=3134134 RepID=UPI0031FEA2D8